MRWTGVQGPELTRPDRPRPDPDFLWTLGSDVASLGLGFFIYRLGIITVSTSEK